MPKNQDFSVQSFFYRKNSFRHWNGVFEEYTGMTDRYIRVYSDQYIGSDAPYWNNERSNIGILATACWKNGWIALEEYSTVKKKDDNSKGAGRCDLWVSSQTGNKNYAIEAKKGSCSLDSMDLETNLSNLLTSACKDAEKLKKDEGDERMGLAFMHVYLKKSKKNKYNELVEITTNKIEKLSKCHNGADFLYVYLKDNGVISEMDTMIPGVIIAGKVV